MTTTVTITLNVKPLELLRHPSGRPVIAKMPDGGFWTSRQLTPEEAQAEYNRFLGTEVPGSPQFWKRIN